MTTIDDLIKKSRNKEAFTKEEFVKTACSVHLR